MNKKLPQYIRLERSKGVPKESIVRALVQEGGWAQADVDRAFQQVASETKSSPGIETASQLKKTSPSNLASQTGNRGRSKKIAITIGAIVLLLLIALGIWALVRALPFGSPKNMHPEAVAEALLETSSLSYRYSADVILDTPSESLVLSSESAENIPERARIRLSLSGEGASSRNFTEKTSRGENSVEASLELPPELFGSAFSSLDAQLETRTVNDTLYVNLIEAPTLGFISLSPLANQWIAVENGLPMKSVNIPNIGALKAVATESLKELIEIHKQTPLVTFSPIDSKEIAGEMSSGFAFTLAKETAPEFMRSALAVLKTAASAQPQSQAALAELNPQAIRITDLSGTLYVGNRSLHPTQLTVETTFNDAKTGTNIIASFSSTFSDFNKPVEIAAPEAARSIESVTQEILSAF